MIDVIVVGAGPAGLVAALALAKGGAKVEVLEAQPDIAINLRGSTFHPSTLDRLEDAFGVASELLARGLKAPVVQYRRHGRGRIAQFDFGDIDDLTHHPFRVQAEQYKLCQALHAKLLAEQGVNVRFNRQVLAVDEGDGLVTVHVENETRLHRAAFVIGADGANSVVRKSVAIEFEGFTWPERFLVVSTPFDFKRAFVDLASVSYVADPAEWYFLLQVPELWRVMFPIPAEESDERALDEDNVQRRLRRVHADGSPYEVAHTTLYKVHQRVAASYRKGRVLLTGDAAHVNNPLGGMGMNGGIHDSFNLAEKLVSVLRGEAGSEALDRFAAERRAVAVDYIQRVSIQNKRDLELSDPAEQRAFETRLRTAEGNLDQRRALLRRLSMIATPTT